jgi:hypothetical protein
MDQGPGQADRTALLPVLCAPLTVITVHQQVVGYWGSAFSYPQDLAVADYARQAAQDAVDKALAELGDSRPASVTVKVVCVMPAEEIIKDRWPVRGGPMSTGRPTPVR